MLDVSRFRADWFREVFIDDELYVTAIDNLLLSLSNPSQVNLKGIRKHNGRWMPANGKHIIHYDDNSSIEAIRQQEKETTSYHLKPLGLYAIKTIKNILLAKRIIIDNDTLINSIDNFIMQELNLLTHGGYIADVVPAPMENIYTLYDTTHNSYLIAKKKNKKRKTYEIDVVGDYYTNKLNTIIDGDATRIHIICCSILNKHMNARKLKKAPFEHVFPCQKIMADAIANMYKIKKDQNVSILVCGPPCVGKSSLATVVAQKIKNDLGVDPHVLRGFNINSEMMQYHPLINYCGHKKQEPMILLLDEFDIAMKNANKDTQGKKSSCAISANKTNLNNFLDEINEEPFLITIVTTNMSLSDIKTNFGIYCRKGRFHIHCEVHSKDIVHIDVL